MDNLIECMYGEQVRFVDPVTRECFDSAGVRSNSRLEWVGSEGVWRSPGDCEYRPVIAYTPAPDQAFKADAGKPRFDLLIDGCPDALLDVVKVLTWAVQEKKDAPWPDGGKGYVPHSWQNVPEAKRRYRAALQRHENAIARGELTDPESGLPHRAHVATNALFLAQLDYINKE